MSKNIIPTETEALNGLNDILEYKFKNRTEIEKLNFKKGFLTYHHWLINRIRKNEQGT